MNDNETFATVQRPVNITVQQVKDLLCNAIEGGSNYWCNSITRYGVDREQAEFRQDVPFVVGGYLMLDWCDNDTGSAKRIDLEAIRNGLTVFAEKCPRQFKDLVEDNTDAETGDCFLQCIVFGEVIYG